ncbi:MAG: DUF4278 domain-containing protein [Prochlorothrix sp.]
MQLRYRGNSYTHDPLQVTIVEGTQSIQFMGSSTTMHHALLSEPATTESHGVYRQVVSDSGPSLKFLGRTYKPRRTVFVPAVS